MKSHLDMFLPEKEISIDAEHTLEQLSGRFQSVKDGLPELIKNSKDHYSRLGVTNPKERQIIIIISEDEKNLGVLDFAGAALEDFNGWKTWSSRIANRKEMAEDIEAGYGNGGKSFMVRGCTKMASMCGYRNNKINKWGFVNDQPNLKFRAGIFKDEKGKELKNVKEENAKYVLNSEIMPFGVNLDSLPNESQEIFNKRKSFTFVSLFNVKSWQGLHGLNLHRTLHHLGTDIMQHAQASLTLETCTVWIMKGSKLSYAEPLKVADLLPFEGLEEIEPIQIPEKLIDPETEEEVELKFINKDKNNLIIKTSRQNLRLSDRLKPRNVIRVRNMRNIVANWLMPDLVPLTSSAHIYGSISCELLDGEHLASSDRNVLADTPLARALKHWTSERCIEIAKEIHRLQSTRNAEEDKDTASETLQKLRDLMREFLQRDSETGESGNIENKGSTKRSGGKSLNGVRVDEIVLESPEKKISLAEGTSVPLLVKCYEHKDGKRLPVRNASLIPCVDNHIVDWIDDNLIKGLKKGTTKLYFETQNGKIKSNQIDIEVHDIDSLKIDIPNKTLKQGEKIRIPVEAFNSNNQRVDDMIYECYVDEIEMGKINRECLFTAGGLEGNATVRIKYGIREDRVSVFQIQIGNERLEGTKGTSGKDIPLILLCGKECPGREDMPKENRTNMGGEEQPTIIDYDPLWLPDAIWINHNSIESKKVRTRGEGQTIKISSMTFQQFLALKCFEILKRLKVEDTFGEDNYSITEFKEALAQAEMDTAGFLDKAYLLVKELIAGEEDEE